MFSKVNISVSARETMENFFENRRIPHAVILEGTSAENRLETAKIIASAFVCTGEEIPCGKCQHCVKIKKNVHPDVIFCDKDSQKSFMGIDVIRSMKSDVYTSANEAERKVYIFKEAQNMTVQSQNALLKVFEEPPEHIAIILTCNFASSLLETIISRGTVISLGEENESSTSDKMLIKAREKANELCLSLCVENELGFMRKTAAFEKDKKLFELVVSNMFSAFSSAAVLKSGGKNIVYDEDVCRKMSVRFTLSQLMEFAHAMSEISESIKRNANHNLTLTRLSSLLANAK